MSVSIYQGYKVVRRLAQVVRHYILGNNITSNPTDLSNYVENNLHIDVLYTNQNDFISKITANNKAHRPQIIINNNLNYYQQMYLLAYSLGYFILKWNWTPNQKVSTNRLVPLIIDKVNTFTTDDKLAHTFANNFLLPTKGLRYYYQNSDTMDLSILKYTISDKYNVSYVFAYHRLNDMRLHGLF